MWITFSDRARKVVFDAQEIARAGSTVWVSGSHLALALSNASELVSGRILIALGVAPDRLTAALGEPSEPADATLSRRAMQLSADAKRIVDLAYDQARLLGDRRVTDEHLLLAVLLETSNSGGKALAGLGVDADCVLSVLDDARSNLAGPSWPPPPSNELLGRSRYRCTKSVSDIIMQSLGYANILGDSQLELEHFLMGIAADHSCSASAILEGLGCDLRALWRAVPQEMGRRLTLTLRLADILGKSFTRRKPTGAITERIDRPQMVAMERVVFQPVADVAKSLSLGAAGTVITTTRVLVSILRGGDRPAKRALGRFEISEGDVVPAMLACTKAT